MPEDFENQDFDYVPTGFDRKETECPECGGTGFDPMDGGQCGRCDGTGSVPVDRA